MQVRSPPTCDASGSGTVTDVLRLKQRKHYIIVPNTDMQGNHQLELCRQMQQYCHVAYEEDEFVEALKGAGSVFAPFPEANTEPLADAIRKAIGPVAAAAK